MNTSTSRRNTFIRAVATISGDIAVGAAVASGCVWIIESAALGLFLSFLVWLIGTLLALAGLSDVVSQVGSDLWSSLMSSLLSASVVRRFRPA